MSFDALTIAGILAVLLCGGFLIALVSCNDISECRGRRDRKSDEGASAESGA